MDGIVSVSELRNFAENMREAIADRDAKAMRDIGEALAKQVDAIPEKAKELFADSEFYTVSRGWGETATSVERGMSHVSMCPVSVREPEIEFLAPDEEKKDAAEYWIPSILADLFAVADKYEIDIYTLLAKAHEFRGH